MLKLVNKLSFNYEVPVKLKSFLEEIAANLYDLSEYKNKALAVSCVSDSAITELNSKFRHKDYPTDVLTFNINDEEILGDIIICWSVLNENARKYKLTTRKELVKILVHSFVHLKGYAHDSEKEHELMQIEEQELFNKLKKKNAKVNWEFIV
jgi:probable rRNA maturation factor